ncbi:hypothetical protein AAVH_35528, partial [Aphelenchoides avenae]
MGHNGELLIHKATAEHSTRVTTEKIFANVKEKLTTRVSHITAIEGRAARWAKFETTLQTNDAHIERHVKRLLENTAGDELVDKTDKVTYDIYLQTRDLKDLKE